MTEIELAHDCGRCAALCCVATSFDVSEDFAVHKPAGVRCVHLTTEDRCAIHARLRLRGFRGCEVYGCHGAGQSVTERFADASNEAREEAFRVLRAVHELLALVTGAIELCDASARDSADALAASACALQSAARADLAGTLVLDVEALHREAHAALRLLGASMGGRRALVVLP